LSRFAHKKHTTERCSSIGHSSSTVVILTIWIRLWTCACASVTYYILYSHFTCIYDVFADSRSYLSGWFVTHKTIFHSECLKQAFSHSYYFAIGSVGLGCSWICQIQRLTMKFFRLMCVLYHVWNEFRRSVHKCHREEFQPPKFATGPLILVS
jgi:hypothetical protein